METGETPSLGPSQCFARQRISIIRSSPSQFIWHAISEMWRWWQRFTSLVCLSSLVSLSRLSRSLHRLSLSSLASSTPSHSQSVHTTYKTWIACQLYFVVLTVHTCVLLNHDRLEWLLNGILSFSQSIHATYEMYKVMLNLPISVRVDWSVILVCQLNVSFINKQTWIQFH